jgi:DNA (cytosine-5)-methyltransferase 1
VLGAYYNEHDDYAADWLEGLIAAGAIPAGIVDRRSVQEVCADDIKPFVQAHFFAGIAGWPLVLRLAGWPDDRPVWTASLPCQPFSLAGKQGRFNDPRHLWPVFKGLVEQRRPSVLFGEQSANAFEWLGDVRNDLEKMEYAVGAVPIEASSAGAYHKRDRFYFVADRNDEQRRIEQRERGGVPEGPRYQPDRSGDAGAVGNAAGHDERGLGDARGSGQIAPGEPGSRGLEWIVDCKGKARRVKSGIRLLADGISGRVAVRRTVERAGTAHEEEHTYSRVGALRGLGNAIDTRPAKAFIEACMTILVPMLGWFFSALLIAVAAAAHYTGSSGAVAG